ncbi:DDE-type integrase/transposase/recombinase [Streptomyces sp. NPDC005492]|uniref:DDE-type integrase/transposase/recombinase n=1 Tax=Streptomyces sp. NPDC005492 TaxID=3156883 RepID=UPI0033BEC370
MAVRRRPSPDFVRRDFTAQEPDLVWAGDMTEIDTGEGKLYLATAIDLFSRRLLGYAMGARRDIELAVASLNMAAAPRGGDVRSVIMHTDRGSEYCSRKFKRARRRLGVVQPRDWPHRSSPPARGLTVHLVTPSWSRPTRSRRGRTGSSPEADPRPGDRWGIRCRRWRTRA